MQSILNKNFINLNSKANSAEDIFTEISEIAFNNEICKNKNSLILKLKERENISTTGFEKGIAIPHTSFDEILKTSIIIVRSGNPVNWNSMDGELTNIFFCILVNPKDDPNTHLNIIANISKCLLDNDFIKKINSLKDLNDFYTLIYNSLIDNQGTSEEKLVFNENKDLYLAVSACTYGIAHTYLVEQKMLKYAKEHNFDIKVETHGMKGDLNIITQEDLKKAKGVIIAVDKNINLSHIVHKNIYKTKTGDVIKDVDNVFKIINNEKKINKKLNNFNFYLRSNLKSSINYSAGWAQGIASFPILIIAMLTTLGSYINWDQIDKFNNLLSFASLLVLPVFSYILITKLAKNGKLSSIVAVSFFVITLYKNINILNIEQVHLVKSYGIIFSLPLVFTVIGIYNAISYKFKLISPRLKLNLNRTIYFFVFLLSAIVIFLYIYFTYDYMSYANEKIYYYILLWDREYWWFRSIIAMIFYGMMVYDMGGPINKWAILLSTLLLVDSFAISPYEVWVIPITAQVIGIVTPGICMGIRGIIFGRYLNEEEKQLCKNSLKDGWNGISEGCIWALKKYKYKYIIANYLTAIYISLVIGYLNINLYMGQNSILGAIAGFSTDNVFEIFGIKFQSFNIGYLILMTTTPIVGGILNQIFLLNSKRER